MAASRKNAAGGPAALSLKAARGDKRSPQHANYQPKLDWQKQVLRGAAEDQRGATREAVGKRKAGKYGSGLRWPARSLTQDIVRWPQRFHPPTGRAGRKEAMAATYRGTKMARRAGLGETHECGTHFLIASAVLLKARRLTMPTERTPDYPKREPYYAFKVARLLWKDKAVDLIGSKGCWLVGSVAQRRRQRHYQSATSRFWNSELCAQLEVQDDQFRNIRAAGGALTLAGCTSGRPTTRRSRISGSTFRPRQSA